MRDYLSTWKERQKTGAATSSPILKMMYSGKWIAVCVMSVCGKGCTSGGVLLTATLYVHTMLIADTKNPSRGKTRPLKPKYMLLSGCSVLTDAVDY